MKRIASFFCAVALLLSATLSCCAAEERASKYFDGYILGISTPGHNQVTVSFSVLGMHKMDQIGAYYIRIEEEVATDRWITTFTAWGDQMPEKFYSYNTYDHDGEYTFTGVPGVKYRAVMKAYACNSEGSEYSDELPCNGKVCK